MRKCSLIVALDTADFIHAGMLARSLVPWVDMFKVGPEFFMANGRPGWDMLQSLGLPMMLDMKHHDIPNTMAGTVRAILPLRPRFITVHASANSEAIKAACDAAGDEITVLAVTVLTSLNDMDLHNIGMVDNVDEQVFRLARIAWDAGVGGLVCSAHEAANLRSYFPHLKLIVAGIRPADTATGDQARPATPTYAVAAGADYLVVGRPIVDAEDPPIAAAAIAAQMHVE